MKRIVMLAVVLTVTLSNATAQTKATAIVPYEIKVNVKGVKDSVLFLAIYTFDKQFLIDTAYKAKDGNYVFKKKRSLDKGMYMIISENKTKYVDFIVNETDKFAMSFDISNVVKTMKFTNTKENEKFMELVTFMADKTVEFADYKKDILNKNSADSTALFREKNKKMNLEVDKFRKDFIKANPTGFVSDFVRLQMEPNISNPLKTKNDTAGTIWQYQFYKNTYWSAIPLGDERILHTPIFADKMKSYFTKIVLQIPDSINAEIPKVMIRTKPSKEMFKWVMFWMTNWSETNKVMGFDAVFVYLINNYYETGEVDFYTPEQVKKITDRGKILGPLLLGKVVPELLCVDTNGIKLVQKVHIDTCKTSECLTNTYMKNKTEIDKKLVSLLALKADYTVLLFWDVDCGHCKKEVPVIFEKFKELRDKEGINIKVHAVYTQHEYDKWLKTLNEMKLQDKDWTNVVDGVHLQNLKEKFDIFSTPVIYILDKNKVIRFKRIAADQLMDVIHNMNGNFSAKKGLSESEKNSIIKKVIEDDKKIKEQLITIPKGLSQENVVSNNVITDVKATVKEEMNSIGEKELNLHVEYFYEVLKATIEKKTDDFPEGGYELASSNAAKLTAQLIKETIENSLAKYFVPGAQVSIKITGTTDGKQISSKIPYNGVYGNFNDKVYFLNNKIDLLNLNPTSGITKNAELAFLRTEGVRKFLISAVPSLKLTKNTFEQVAIVKSEVGSQYRRISVEIVIHDAFNPQKNLNDNNDLSKLFIKCKKPVFTVLTSDGENKFQGTGFFINSTGVAVSNFHVFENTLLSNARIYTEDGNVYEIEKIIEKNEISDFIIFKVKNSDGIKFPFAKTAFLESIEGEKVFSISNPEGLEKTLSNGIISGFRDEKKWIQTTTPITHGSSGGPLFNMRGEVIGITTKGKQEGSLFFATNIKNLNLMGFEEK